MRISMKELKKMGPPTLSRREQPQFGGFILTYRFAQL
jgi:hypothetical protein